MSINIYSKPGTKVMGNYDEEGNIKGGYDHEKRQAEELLEPGKIYEIEKMDVKNWYTNVKLVGIDRIINSVCLMHAEPQDGEQLNLFK